MASFSLKSPWLLPLRTYRSSSSAPQRTKVSQIVVFGIDPSCNVRISASTVWGWGSLIVKPIAIHAEVRTFQKLSRRSSENLNSCFRDIWLQILDNPQQAALRIVQSLSQRQRPTADSAELA
jgi:hypothetical protein